MLIYHVTSESKDGQLYLYSCIATSKRTAILSSNKSLIEKGWEKHEYIPIDIKIVEPVNEKINYIKSEED